MRSSVSDANRLTLIKNKEATVTISAKQYSDFFMVLFSFLVVIFLVFPEYFFRAIIFSDNRQDTISPKNLNVTPTVIYP